MTELPKVTLRSYRPLWRGWVTGILREIDQAIRNETQLSTDTLTAADNLESLMSRMFLPQFWSTNLLTRLEFLEYELLKEQKEEVQRALDLTQGLIHDIREN
jgi:hypothetical protein